MAKPLVLIFGILHTLTLHKLKGLRIENKAPTSYIASIRPKASILRDFYSYEDTPRNEKHFEALVMLAVLRTAEVDFLKKSYGVNDTADVLVSPDRVKDLEQFVHRHNMPVKYKYNYGRSLELKKPISIRRRLKAPLNDYHISPYNSNRFNSYDRFTYNSYDTITKYIDTLQNRVPDLVVVKNLGFSYEKRMMQLVKISTDPHAGNPVIFIDAGVHAREWVAPAMAMYIIHRLTSDPTARSAELDGVDWYILPVVNPDGYEFSREYNRMWRKTRSQHSERSYCVGVDGNRNFGFKWGGTGASRDPCDEEVYAGPGPFSEVETQMVSRIMMQYKDRIKLYVTLHGYGQYLVYPWGYTTDILPKNWKKLNALARQVSGSVKKAGGRPFRVMSSGKWYVAAGASDDYALGAAGIPYSYTMELTKGYEFLFPERHLPKVMPRFYEGFKTFGAQIKLEFANHNS